VNILLNKRFQLGAAIIIAAVIGVVVGVIVAGSGTVSSVKEVATTVATGEFSQPTVAGRVTLTTGPSIPLDFSTGSAHTGDNLAGHGAAWEATIISLPLTATGAVEAGWEDPILCSVGRGRYFQNGPAGEGDPYFLMYDSTDNLIGLYLFSEEGMPAPWEREDSLAGAGGLTIIDYEHWGLFVYFQDSIKACESTEADEGSFGVGSPFAKAGDKSGITAAGSVGAAEMGGRSTPTPFVPPTPTPTVDTKISQVVSRTAQVTKLTFTLKGDPAFKNVEGTLGSKATLSRVVDGMVTVTDSAGTAEVAGDTVPLSFDNLGATLSAITAAIQEPVEAKSTWVDSLSREGLTGTVLGSDLSALIPTAVADARVAVSIWFDDRGRIVRLRIEGKVTPNDPPDAVRVLDVGAFRG